MRLKITFTRLSLTLFPLITMWTGSSSVPLLRKINRDVEKILSKKFKIVSKKFKILSKEFKILSQNFKPLERSRVLVLVPLPPPQVTLHSVQIVHSPITQSAEQSKNGQEGIFLGGKSMTVSLTLLNGHATTVWLI